MDNDPQALAFVEANVATQLPSNTVLKPVRYNALRTRSAEATIRNFGKFDIIYSVGLLDYLPDDQLVALLIGWRDTLAPGGVMYVAFKDTLRYDKTPYQWHLNWFFFQRTEADCLHLFELAGFDTDEIDVTRDGTGIIINFISRKPRPTFLRVDEAEVKVRHAGNAHNGRDEFIDSAVTSSVCNPNPKRKRDRLAQGHVDLYANGVTAKRKTQGCRLAATLGRRCTALARENSGRPCHWLLARMLDRQRSKAVSRMKHSVCAVAWKIDSMRLRHRACRHFANRCRLSLREKAAIT